MANYTLQEYFEYFLKCQETKKEKSSGRPSRPKRFPNFTDSLNINQAKIKDGFEPLSLLSCRCTVGPVDVNYISDSIEKGVKDLISKRLKDKTMKKIKVRREKMAESWDFQVPHPDLIDDEEISSNISRKNPIIVVLLKDFARIFIYNGIFIKSALIQIPPPHFLDIKYGHRCTIMEIKKTKIKKLIQWVSWVRKSPWGNKAEKGKVTVFIPKI